MENAKVDNAIRRTLICQGDKNKPKAKLSKLLVLNVCQFVLFVVQVVTGGWIWFDILEGIRPSIALLRFHPISGIVLTVFILSHIYMNRKWIKVQLFNQKL
jgi:cytochrome b subunit of formate dehydrogenase